MALVEKAYAGLPKALLGTDDLASPGQSRCRTSADLRPMAEIRDIGADITTPQIDLYTASRAMENVPRPDYSRGGDHTAAPAGRGMLSRVARSRKGWWYYPVCGSRRCGG